LQVVRKLEMSYRCLQGRKLDLLGFQCEGFMQLTVIKNNLPYLNLKQMGFVVASAESKRVNYR